MSSYPTAHRGSAGSLHGGSGLSRLDAAGFGYLSGSQKGDSDFWQGVRNRGTARSRAPWQSNFGRYDRTPLGSGKGRSLAKAAAALGRGRRLPKNYVDGAFQLAQALLQMEDPFAAPTVGPEGFKFAPPGSMTWKDNAPDGTHCEHQSGMFRFGWVAYPFTPEAPPHSPDYEGCHLPTNTTTKLASFLPQHHENPFFGSYRGSRLRHGKDRAPLTGTRWTTTAWILLPVGVSQAEKDAIRFAPTVFPAAVAAPLAWAVPESLPIGVPSRVGNAVMRGAGPRASGSSAGEPPAPPRPPRDRGELPHPPGPGTKEKKGLAQQAFAAATKVAFAATEVNDAVDVFVDAIDEDCAGENAPNSGIRDRWAYAYKHATCVDIDAFARGLIANYIEDKVIGKSNAKAQKAMKALGFSNYQLPTRGDSPYIDGYSFVDLLFGDPEGAD